MEYVPGARKYKMRFIFEHNGRYGKVHTYAGNAVTRTYQNGERKGIR